MSPVKETLARYAVASILLIAAVGKCLSLIIGEPPPGVLALFGSELPVLLLAQGEFLLAARLLHGGWTRTLWRFCILLFGAFLAASIYGALSGMETCGCFGSALILKPWAVAVLDLFIIAALLKLRPRTPEAVSANERRLRLNATPILLAILLGLAVWPFLSSTGPTEVSTGVELHPSGTMV